MAEKGNAKDKKGTLTFEKAVSGRSTCRATGDSIAKGEDRVGLEAYVGGRVAMTWQKALPFLQGCKVEHSKNSAGKCKHIGSSFTKGEPRFVASIGADKRVLLSLEAAGELLTPVLKAVTAEAFTPTDFQDLDVFTADERARFYKVFSVAKKAAADFDRSHPAPEEGAPVGKPSKSKPKSDKEGGKGEVKAEVKKEVKKKVKVEVKEEDEEEEEASEGESDEEEEDEEASQSDSAEKEENEEVDDAAPEDDNENEYERVRREQIARNEARMMELQLPGMAAQLIPTQQAKSAFKPRGLAARKRKAPEVDPGPRRASLRQLGVSADGTSIDAEKRNGEIVIINGERIRMMPNEYIEAGPKERHPKGPVVFKSTDGGPRSDEAFLKLLALTATTPVSDAKKALGKQLAKLPLKPDDVAKMTHDGIVHLAFHPASDAIILAAGDKGGHVGLWHIDREAPSSGGEPKVKGSVRNQKSKKSIPTPTETDTGDEKPAVTEGEDAEGDEEGDGAILDFTPHGSYICGLKWVGGAGAAAKLFTCSYDGSIRALDPAAGAFQLVHSDEDAEYSAFNCTQDGTVLFVGDKDGNMEVMDIRTAETKVGKAVSLHDKKVNTLDLEPGSSNRLASCCSDGTLAVWDVRSLKPKCQPVASASHAYACQSAFFAPDGSQRVLSTSRDNTLTVWSEKLEATVKITHNNNTGRWISPFRAIWSPAADSIICGNMKRAVDVYDQSGKDVGHMSHELMGAIPSRCAIHPNMAVMAAATGSGRMHIFRN